MDVLAIIRRIEVLLKQQGKTKSEFYEECELTSSAFSQWRTGKTTPSSNTLQRIADYLGVTYEHLVTGLEQKENPPAISDEGKSDEELISRLVLLTPDEMQKVDAFVQGLLAAR